MSAKKAKQEPPQENKADGQQKEIRLTGEQILLQYNDTRARLETVQSRIRALAGMRQDMLLASTALKAISSAEEGEKILVALGAGIYIEAEAKNVKKAKKLLAGNVMVDDDAEATIKSVQEELEKTGRTMQELQREEQGLGQNLNALAQIIQRTQELARRQMQGQQ
ncbi:MAG: hypothetical protein HY394_06525 [Candidatus Diapherotrites archaeon]|nr:hypothetical protein [Candidatus Diapherotrites archaeon]